MTENEAIIELIFFKEKLHNGIFGHKIECFDFAIKGFEELQKYRSIGTIDEIYQTKRDLDAQIKHSDKIAEVLKSTKNILSKRESLLKEYSVIGTVSECQESMEKQSAKKPVKYGDTRQGLDCNGNSISIQQDCYECPVCESFLGYVSDCKDEHYQDDYCRNCGQAIDWSDTP